ncbi:carbamate kinase [Tepidicaulis marinus]|uniref:carbamate kinase n=1 Tax=Tepidicaulis marinus TaxID=1333998 RepID=UPI0005EF0355|nr:carbamate kinase [Tepidicaulis marinus]
MRVVVAIGGNALLERGEVLSAETQQRNMARAAGALAQLADGNEMVLVHGNGPQVGLLALEGEAFKEAPPFPLDVLGAESQGMIGYVIAQELRNVMPHRQIATLITQTQVDPDDPAFGAPSKPIGPVYSEAEARALADERGWQVAADGDYFRRVVPSPQPAGILEFQTIRLLAGEGTVVICAGGGGVPVIVGARGQTRGVEAVIDKDLAASLLARKLGADRLIILTDVDAVYEDWGTARARKIGEARSAQLRTMSFAKGSMGPKVDAVCRFVEETGRPAAIGSLKEAASVADGTAGTQILP